MNRLYNVGAIVSFLLVAIGLFLLWKLGPPGNDLSLCILALVSGTSMGLLFNVLSLRDRIAAIEKQQEK